MELRLPPFATINSGRLSIGNGLTRDSAKPSTGRVRIGTSAVFRLSSLDMGFNGSSGRIEARTPGSTLTISGNNATSRLGSLIMGNTAVSPGIYDTAIDMENGTLNLLAGNVALYGGSSATTPTQASIRFGDGTVDVGSLTLGGTPQNAYDYRCLMVQTGGSAKIGNLVLAPTSFSTLAGTRTHRYQLHGGTLELRNVTGAGALAITGTLSRGIDWRGGTLRNLANQSTSFFTTGAGVVTSPIDLTLFGSGLRTLHVETGHTFTLGVGTRLSSETSSITLLKTGQGTLTLAGDSTGFTGDFHLNAGILSLGQNIASAAAHAGSLVWDSGTLACDLDSAFAVSDHWHIERAFTRGDGPATAGVIDLKSSLGNGTYTLATYSSTDLTLADFTATGIRSGHSAEFTVGPTALTVVFAPETAFTAWRLATLASSTNLGSAHDFADPDSDGRPNLLEYAFGSAPLAPDSASPVALARDPLADRLALTFSRIADPSLTYSVHASSSPAGPWNEVVFTSTGADNTPGTITVADSVSLSSHPRRFIRLSVSR